MRNYAYSSAEKAVKSIKKFADKSLQAAKALSSCANKIAKRVHEDLSKTRERSAKAYDFFKAEGHPRRGTAVRMGTGVALGFAPFPAPVAVAAMVASQHVPAEVLASSAATVVAAASAAYGTTKYAFEAVQYFGRRAYTAAA